MEVKSYLLEATADDRIQKSLTVSAVHDDEGGDPLFRNASADSARW